MAERGEYRSCNSRTADRCDVHMLDLSKVRLLDFRVSLNGCRVFLQRLSSQSSI